MKKLTSLLLTVFLLFSVVSVSTVTASALSKVTNLKAYNIDDDEINLKWSKVSSATGYQIYMYNESLDKWSKVGTSKTNKYEVEDLYSAKSYKFRVRAYKKTATNTVYGSYSSVLVSATDPDEVDNLKVSAKGKTSLTLKWSKVKRATGYQVYVYDSAKGKYVKAKTVKTNSAKVTGLKNGVTYKVKVRAYFKYDGTAYYGEFSDVVKGKTTGTSSGSSASKTLIGAAKAKSVALEHAGLTSSAVRGLECELDTQYGVKVYEVDFEYGKYDYSYDIDAYSGKVLRYEKEIDD